MVPLILWEYVCKLGKSCLGSHVKARDHSSFIQQLKKGSTILTLENQMNGLDGYKPSYTVCYFNCYKIVSLDTIINTFYGAHLIFGFITIRKNMFPFSCILKIQTQDIQTPCLIYFYSCLAVEELKDLFLHTFYQNQCTFFVC